MKKSTLVLSALTVATVAITGGAWFSGKQLEKNSPEFLAAFEKSLVASAKAGNVDVVLKNVKQEHGIFSSKLSFDIDAKTASNDFFTFQGKSKIYHGPIPLNRLIKLNLLPVAAAAKAEISSQDEIFQTAFNHKPIVTADLALSYSGALNVDGVFNPMDNEKEKIKTSEIRYQGDLSGFGKQKISAESIRIGEAGANHVQLRNLTFESDFIRSEHYPLVSNVGPYHFRAESAHLNLGNGEQFNFSQLTSSGNGEFKNGRIIADSTFGLNIDAENQDLKLKENIGKLTLKSSANIDAKAFNDLLPQIQQNSPQAGEFYTALLNKSPVLDIQELSLENGKGKNVLSLHLEFADFNPNELNDIKQILAIFKASEFKGNINIASGEKLLKQLMLFDAATKDLAEKQAPVVMQQFIAQAKASGLAVVSPKEISMKLNIDEGKVRLNGAEVSQEQVEMALFSIMLALGGFGR